MYLLGRGLMVVGLGVGAYAMYKGMFGSQIGMGEVGASYKALAVALGFFISGYLFSKDGGAPDQSNHE